MRTHKLIAAVVAAGLLSALVVATPADAAASKLGYKHLTAVEVAGGKIKVSWRKTTNVKKFTVKTAGNYEMTTDVKSYKVSKKKVSVLVAPSRFSKAGTGNYTFIRLYALKSTGVTVQSKSAIVRMRAVAPDPAGAQQTIASFNVRTQKADSSGHPWSSRVGAIASQIQQSAASVVSVQEAGEILADNGYTAKAVHHDFYWQFQDLRDKTNAAGSTHYALVDDQEYSPHGAAGREGTRILYDTARLTVLGHGSFAPSAIDSNLRFVPWALFQDKTTGKQFYFIAVHLDDRADKGKSRTYYDLRTKQTAKIIDVATGFAAKGLQVMVVGDFNSNIYSKPNNGADRQMISAHFFDGYATAHNVNEYWDTYNGFIKPVKKYSRVDYFFTIGGPKGSYSYKNWLIRSGTFPSDHDMQTAVLPY